MSLPKEPRQLMINLMYLVLTALLALNVSNEILHAFKVINQSIGSSNTSIQEKNAKLYDFLKEQANATATHDRFGKYNDRAQSVKKASDDMIAYLEAWKERVIETAGGRDKETKEISREDNIDASTHLLVENKGGDTLKKKLEEFRTMLLNSVFLDDAKKQLDHDLPIKIDKVQKTDNNPRADWSMSFFHNMPTVAAVTLLSKFQNDVRNSEALIVNELTTEAGNLALKFDEMQAIAVPKTTYALAGQKIEANIMMAAYNKKVTPQVSISSGHVTKIENGLASWEVQAAGVGPQKVHGSVTLDMGTMGPVKRDFDFEYVVGSTGASIQLDKMNVFYIGVPNPITVSAAGYALEDIQVVPENTAGTTITQAVDASGKKILGKYIVNVNSSAGKTTMVDIKANDKAKGGLQNVGKMEVRVKSIPDPTPEVGGKSYGVLAANIFRAQIGVVAQLHNFDFDTRFVVTEFNYSWLPRHKDIVGPVHVVGSNFNAKQEVKDYQNQVKPGDKIFIEDIKAKGPDGKIRSLPSITLNLN